MTENKNSKGHTPVKESVATGGSSVEISRPDRELTVSICLRYKDLEY